MSGRLNGVPVFELGQIIAGPMWGVLRSAEPGEDFLEVGGIGAEGAYGEGADYLGDGVVAGGGDFYVLAAVDDPAVEGVDFYAAAADHVL